VIGSTTVTADGTTGFEAKDPASVTPPRPGNLPGLTSAISAWCSRECRPPLLESNQETITIIHQNGSWFMNLRRLRRALRSCGMRNP